MKWVDIDGNPLSTWKRRILILFEGQRLKIFWAWFDFWIGVYPNMAKNVLYVVIIPTLVIQIYLKRERQHMIIELPNGNFHDPNCWCGFGFIDATCQGSD